MGRPVKRGRLRALLALAAAEEPPVPTEDCSCSPPGKTTASTFTWVDFLPESKQSFDKDGFLLVRDVPIARIGVQIYGPGETPIAVGDGGIVRIQRDPEEVFHPDTITSVMGAPFVNDHPTDGEGNRIDVTPDNWRHLAVGHVENPRRGEGDFSDFLMADVRIHDRDAIELIRRGKRQVSCGYDADYEELGPGHGRQKNIRCNHLALVTQARCGPVCAIGDSFTTDCQETTIMPGAFDRIRALAKEYGFKARDTAELEAALADAEEAGGADGTHVHLHMSDPRRTNDAEEKEDKDDEEKDKTEDARHAAHDAETEELWEAVEELERAIVMGADAKFKPRDGRPARDARRVRMGIRRSRDEKEDEDKDKTEDRRERDEAVESGGNRMINAELEIEAPPGAQVIEVHKARDSRFLEDSWTETLSLGEILVPGIRLPTFDRASAKEVTYDALTAFRRRVLDLAYVQPEGRDLIDEFAERPFSGAAKLSGGEVRKLFRDVGRAKRRVNAAATVRGSRPMPARDTNVAGGGPRSISEYQKQLDAFYQRPPR